MKKIISVMLSLVLIFSSLSVSITAFAVKTTSVAKTRINDSETFYEYDVDTKTLTISGEGAIPNMTNNDSSQPWSNWRSDGSIENVIVEEGITAIGNYVLYYVYAKNVQLPSTLTKIGNYALAYNNEVTSYDIPFGVKTIGTSAFENCISLEEIEIPDTVTLIGNSAFKQCYKLESVIIPHSVTSIGNYAFHRCSVLNSVKFESLTTLGKIGNYAFQNCPLLDELVVPAYTTVGKTFYGVSDAGKKYDNASMKLFSGSDAIVYAKTKSIPYTILDEISIELGAVNKDEFVEETVSNAVDYSFTPETSGVYNIYSTGDVDLSAVLSDDSGELLRSDDISKDNLNFCLTYNMEAGKKYVITVTSVRSVGEYAVIAYPDEIESFIVNGSLAFNAEDGKPEGGKRFFEITDDMLEGFILDISFKGGFTDRIYYSPQYFNNRIIGIADNQNEFPFTCGNNTENISIGDVKGGFNVYIEHTPAVDEAVESTCTKTGLTEGSSCLLCKKVFVPQETVEMKPHTYETAVTEPTCGEKGYSTHTCSVCGYSYVDEYTDATGLHLYNDEVTKEPSCSETGIRTYTCSVCGDTYDEGIEKLPHTPADAVEENRVEATCTADGSYDEVVYCSVCKAELSRETKSIEKLAHNYKAEVTAPTCTEKGYTTYTCEDCGDTYIEDYVYALCHTPADAVEENRIEATCTAEGTYDEVVYCLVCNEELSRETKSIEKLAHNYKAEVTAPTCTEKGYTTYTCEDCGDSYIDDYVDALGHTEVTDEAVAPTCTETGLTEGKHCSVCSAVLVAQEEVAALGHTEVTDEAVAPTCTETGLTEGKHCSVCGETLVAQETVNAKGHKLVADNAVAATFKKAGKTSGKHCSVCGYVAVAQKKVAKLGKPSLSSVSAQSKGFKAKWKSVKSIGGYQIQYSTDKNFKKGNKTVKISGYKSKTKTVKSLKAKRKYYVRIRAYKKINGKMQYSAWSKKKTVTTKK